MFSIKSTFLPPELGDLMCPFFYNYVLPSLKSGVIVSGVRDGHVRFQITIICTCNIKELLFQTVLPAAAPSNGLFSLVYIDD